MSKTTLQMILDANVKLTPMMEQYSSIKKNYRDHLLLFRMGDFYEVFFEDAVQASKILNITLTHRGKVGDFPIPMAGIPHHAAATYIDRLSNTGLKVAICEQVQDPKEAKGIVQRAVTQVVSPGMPFDLEKTESRETRFMVSTFFSEENQTYNIIALDFTTGEFNGVQVGSQEEFLNKILMIGPKEIITFMGQWDDNKIVHKFFDDIGVLKTYLSEDYFNSEFTAPYMKQVFPGYQRDKILKQHEELLPAIGALSYYVCSTQNLETFFHIRPFRLINEQNEMKVTLPTLQGLEILPRNRDRYNDSLLGYMDRTRSALGARRLKKFLSAPLFDIDEISRRQDTIEKLLGDFSLLEDMREELSEIRDLERILAKVSTNKATPSDLINTSRAVQCYESLSGKLKKDFSGLLPFLASKELKSLKELSETIEKTINDEVGASLEKGNLIKPGADKKRDKLSRLALNANDELVKLEERYREETGIPKLRVKSNNIAGFFIEVSKSYTNQVPKHFDRRQTLVNSERYTTEELIAFEKEIVSAKEKLERLEREIFKGITESMGELSSVIQSLADALSIMDALQSLAWISYQDDFTRPTFGTEKRLVLKQAWHPLIKHIIKDQFVCHDINLTSEVPFGLITGPNMAGKTTVMREVAIVQILAQVGSFVPAEVAELHLCDFLFSRLGASDDILKGQSTFMVEMSETAEIIRHATDKSLVILDEVGRGTSTYDGLSIAWAIVEHLVHNTKCFALFATHYHELIELVEGIPTAKNLTVETRNEGDHVEFLYRLIEEGASQSFGIYVAKLAGLPPSLLHRAGEILHGLEKEGTVPGQEPKGSSKSYQGTQLDFFPDSQPIIKVPPYLEKLEKEMLELDLNNMTPLQMMNKVENLKNQLNSAKFQ